MGNAQCGLQGSSSFIIAEDEYTSSGDDIRRRAAGDAAAGFSSKQQQQQPVMEAFLSRVHQPDKQALCILEQHAVTQALVKQGEELIRREEDANNLRLVSTFTSSSSGSSSGSDDRDAEILSMSVFTSSSKNAPPVDGDGDDEAPSVVSSVSSSMFQASSVMTGILSRGPALNASTRRSSALSTTGSDWAPSTVTTTSTMTQQVQNSVKSNKRRQRYSWNITSQNHHGAPPSPIPEADFDSSTDCSSSSNHMPDNSITTSVVDEKKQVQRESSSSSSIQAKLQLRAGCLLPLDLLLTDTTIDQFGSQQHMNILHLRLGAKCTDYFKKNLSTLFPYSPMTRALTEGGNEDLHLSPSRTNTSRHYSSSPPVPHLARSHSESTSSSSNTPDIGFGEGPPSQPVQLLVMDASFLDLAVTGSLGLVQRPRRSQSRDVSITGTGRKFIEPPEHYIVLLNRRSGAPLAVCALKADSMNAPVVRIYATKRRFAGQRPAATTKKLGLTWGTTCAESWLPLYTWAQIVTEGQYPEAARYSIFMASGNDGRFEHEPSYRAMNSSSGSPTEIRVVGRTRKESAYTGCAILSLQRDENEDAAAEHDNELYFRMSLAKGVDPALFICFAAFMDEAMEKKMMMQCETATENLQRSMSQTRQRSLVF